MFKLQFIHCNIKSIIYVLKRGSSVLRFDNKSCVKTLTAKWLSHLMLNDLYFTPLQSLELTQCCPKSSEPRGVKSCRHDTSNRLKQNLTFKSTAFGLYYKVNE